MLQCRRMAADERPRQVIAGVAVIAGFSALLVLIAAGRFLPGLGGEFFARILGIISTPFLMEVTLAVMGLVLVLTLNHWRQRREGDELVYLEEIDQAPAGLPEQARWAIYPQEPLPAESPSAADLLEGALAIGDHPAALDILATMDDTERRQPAILRHRIALALATGKVELARRLEDELAGRAD